MKKKKNILEIIIFVLVIIGAVNLGFVALDFHLLEFIFGAVPVLLDVLYLLIGISGLFMIYLLAEK